MGSRQRGHARNSPPPADDEKPTATAQVLSRIIERTARVQRPAVRAYLERLRNADPGAGPADTVAKLERHYRSVVITSGAVVGSLAAVPGIGTLLALAAIAGETVVFLEATAFFVLAVAEVHNIPADRREQRRALVLAVLVGDDGKRAVGDLLGSGRTGGGWLSEGAVSLPLPALAEVNSRLLRHVIRRYTLRRGVLTFGKLLPVGLGAVVGGVGNRMMGKRIITNARKAFGAPPNRWPVTLHLLPTMHDEGAAPDRGAAVRLPGRRSN